eukprot:3530544-Rhodomonas_salina.1
MSCCGANRHVSETGHRELNAFEHMRKTGRQLQLTSRAGHNASRTQNLRADAHDGVDLGHVGAHVEAFHLPVQTHSVTHSRNCQTACARPPKHSCNATRARVTMLARNSA